MARSKTSTRAGAQHSGATFTTALIRSKARPQKGENELHALKLDWKRFVTDQTIDFIKNEVDAIREGGSELPVTANLMYDFDGLDYKKFKDVLDIVSWDNYPGWHKKRGICHSC